MFVSVIIFVSQIGVEFHDLGKAKVGKYFDIVRGLYLRGFKVRME